MADDEDTLRELLAAGAPVGAHWIAARQSAPLLMRFGSEAQRQEFLPRIAAGELDRDFDVLLFHTGLPAGRDLEQAGRGRISEVGAAGVKTVREFSSNPNTDETIKRATISEDGLYRYALSRTWEGPIWSLAFIMLNPSTADATEDDPTIRKCIGFAQRNGCNAIEVVNLFAFRATDPNDLRRAGYPVSPMMSSFFFSRSGGAL